MRADHQSINPQIEYKLCQHFNFVRHTPSSKDTDTSAQIPYIATCCPCIVCACAYSNAQTTYTHLLYTHTRTPHTPFAQFTLEFHANFTHIFHPSHEAIEQLWTILLKLVVPFLPVRKVSLSCSCCSSCSVSSWLDSVTHTCCNTPFPHTHRARLYTPKCDTRTRAHAVPTYTQPTHCAHTSHAPTLHALRPAA